MKDVNGSHVSRLMNRRAFLRAAGLAGTAALAACAAPPASSPSASAPAAIFESGLRYDWNSTMHCIQPS